MGKISVDELNELLKVAVEKAGNGDLEKANELLRTIRMFGLGTLLDLVLSEFVASHYIACLKESKDDKRILSVYFLKSKVSGLIKIGKTTDDVENRINQISGMCAGGVELVKVINNADEKLESDLHRKFNDLQINGEWFSPGAALLDYIDKIR